MKLLQSKKVSHSPNKDLKVIIQRQPFSDFTNVTMPKSNKKTTLKAANKSSYLTVNVQKSILPTKENAAPKTKVQDEQKIIKQDKPVCNINIKSRLQEQTDEGKTRTEEQISPRINDLLIKLPKIDQIIYGGTKKSKNIQQCAVRQNSPLDKDLRKGNAKPYLESTLKELNPTSTVQNPETKESENIQQCPVRQSAPLDKSLRKGNAKTYLESTLKELNPNPTVQNAGLNKSENIQQCPVRQSTPLVKRLRKGNTKTYLESTFKEFSPKPTAQNVSNTSIKPKVPIYKQPIPVITKNNLKDPYALDIIDSDELKQKRKKVLNDSAKFNKTMYEVLQKLEKKEQKPKKRVKIQKSYEENIQNVLKRVLKKVNKNKPLEVDPVKDISTYTSKNLSISHNNQDLANSNTTQNAVVQIESINNKSFDDISKSSMNLTNYSETEDSFKGFVNNINTRSSHLYVFDKSLRSLEISMESIPSTSRSSNINILSDVCLTNANTAVTHRYVTTPTSGNITNTIFANASASGTNNKRNLTSLEANPIEKSRNLYREFNEHLLPTLNNQSTTNQEYFSEDELDVDYSSAEDSEVEEVDDEYFGFHDCETPENVKRFSHKKKLQPWRFQGFFKRNPHILKIKKNGLPSIQQEMVLDYEFVQRIEALSSNKVPELPQPKPPVQTSILDYVENSHDHQQETTQPSLFDYEDFNVAKPRRVLGVLQDNQIMSTPVRGIQTVVASPNISIIPRGEDDKENSPEKNRLLQKSYQKKTTKGKDVGNEEKLDDMLPSVLDKDYEEVQDAEIHLFDDVDNVEKPDFNITLINVKYDRKRRRNVYEDDEEKMKKKKKKNMMTKAEEAEFEAWAATTNARFAEEDKHELTIE